MAPFLYELSVCLAYWAYLAIDIVESDGVHVAVLFAQRRVPIDLTGQRIPCESNDRHSIGTRLQDVGPLFSEPQDCFVAVRPLRKICLRVHHRQAIALVILRLP